MQSVVCMNEVIGRGLFQFADNTWSRHSVENIFRIGRGGMRNNTMPRLTSRWGCQVLRIYD